MTADERKHIEDTIASLAVGARAGGGKRLQGRTPWSLRVGGRRGLFRVDEPARTIFVTFIGARGDIYKKP